MHSKKTAFIVEHDFIMATYLADRVVVYTGQPSVEATATAPQSLLTGMNQFLEQLSVTFRRDPTNFRPRINKLNSVKDRDQKAAGNYFFMDNGAGPFSKSEKEERRQLSHLVCGLRLFADDDDDI